MIQFQKVRYKNFLSSGNKFIEIDLNSNKTNLLIGKNGAGKSIFTDVVTFALFSKPFRKINKPQLINNVNKSNLEVEIEFTINNVRYKVRRGLKPAIFEIYEDGRFMNQDSDSGYDQDYLESSILKMNYKAFTQIVIVGHATYMPFMKLSPADRRIIIENILDIDIFSKMNTILKQDVLQTKEDINDVIHKHDIAKEKIKIYKDNLLKSRASIEEKIVKNNEIVSQLETQIALKTESINDLHDEMIEITSDETTLSKIRESISELSGYEITIKNKLKTIRKEINFFSDNDVCSTCHQDIDAVFRHDILKKNQDDEEKFQDGLNKAQAKIRDLELKLNETVESIDKINKINADITKKNMELSYLQKEMKRVQDENISLEEDKATNLKDIEAEFNRLQTESESLLIDRDNLLNVQHINSLAGVLLKDDGIKTKIIRNYLPTMNKMINKYLGMMDFFINFNLDENFEEVIKMANRENFSYNSFSEGEKLRIDLAILFTWREIARLRNSASTNLLILDEVFDSSLDSTGIDDFLKIINTLSKNTNIFIISHKEEILTDKFSNVIKFEKVKGFSRIII